VSAGLVIAAVASRQPLILTAEGIVLGAWPSLISGGWRSQRRRQEERLSSARFAELRAREVLGLPRTDPVCGAGRGLLAAAPSLFDHCLQQRGVGGTVFAYLGDVSLRTVRVHLSTGATAPLTTVIPLAPALDGDHLLVVVVPGQPVTGDPEFD
jgi:hypothetical protein